MTRRRSGVYEILNTVTGKRYVGSAVDIRHRWGTHRSWLRTGRHVARHLLAAWNKYGSAAFAFRVLLWCAPEQLLFYEQRAMDHFQSFDPGRGYNARPRAESNRGFKQSPAECARIAEMMHRRGCPPETRRRISAALMGNKNGAGVVRAWSHCKRGHAFTPDNTKIQSNGNKRCRECLRSWSREKNWRRRGLPRRLRAD